MQKPDQSDTRGSRKFADKVDVRMPNEKNLSIGKCDHFNARIRNRKSSRTTRMWLLIVTTE